MKISEADYKGTCVLCLDSVRHGDLIVKIKYATMGTEFDRNVHVRCYNQLVDSTPEGPEREAIRNSAY